MLAIWTGARSVKSSTLETALPETKLGTVQALEATGSSTVTRTVASDSVMVLGSNRTSASRIPRLSRCEIASALAVATSAPG